MNDAAPGAPAAAILAASPDAIVTIDVDGTIQQVNPETERMFGYAPGELVGRNIDTLMPSDYVSAHREGMKRYLATGEARVIGERVRVEGLRSNGTRFPLHLHITSFTDDDRQYFVGILQDLTEHASLQEKTAGYAHDLRTLQRESERTANILEGTNAGTWDWHIVRDEVTVNRRWAEITGHTLEEIGRMDTQAWHGTVHPDDLPEVLAKLEQHYKGERDYYDAEFRMRHKDGHWIWVQSRGKVVERDPEGNPVRVSGIHQDITERKAAEEELRRQREQYRTLVESTTAILWEGDPETLKFTFVSHEAESLLGYPVGQWLSDPDFWVDHMHPDDREWAPDFCVEQTAKLQQHSFDYRMISADGRVVWLRDVVNVVADQGRPIKNVGIMLDVTATKKAEQALEYLSGLQRALVDVSHRFMATRPDEVDRQIDHALGLVGHYCDVDRAYLFRFRDGLERTDNTHEWCAPGVTPEIDNLQDLPRREIPNVVSLMERREVMHVPRVAELEEDWSNERRIFEAEDIQSLVVVPIVSDDALHGFLGFDSVKREREWTHDEIHLLQALGNLLGAVIQRRDAESALRESEALRSQAENLANLGSWQWDIARDVFTLSPEWRRVCGCSAERLTSDEFYPIAHPDDLPIIRQALQHSIRTGEPYRIEHRIIRQTDGEVRWVRAHAEVVHENGLAVRMAGFSQDITGQREAEHKMAHLAHHDALTDLPNRTLALDRLEQMLRSARRRLDQVAIVFLDLDHFKKVNDTLGHETGDQLLLEATRRLTGIVREQDTVARMGGDEFVILLGGIHGESDAQPVLESLLEHFRRPFVVEGREMVLTASVGVALAPTDGNDPQELLRNADTAMYKSKAEGRNTYRYFTASMNHDIERRLAIEENLRGALDRGELSLRFQPLIELAEDRIVGAEALVRWRNPELGNVSPAEFIPIAEQTGLIDAIGTYVAEQALAQARAWSVACNRSFRISINVSPQQFRDPHFTRRLGAMIDRAGISPSGLEIEVTEGVLLTEQTHVGDALRALRDMGVGISMDDFGTGYASLSYLRQYPFDTLKIDQSFVRDCTTDPNDAELVATSLRLAAGLGLDAIAEGVETAAQLAFLRDNDCRLVQGYLFSPPITAEALTEMLRNGNGRAVAQGRT